MITAQQVVAYVGRYTLQRSAPYLDGALFNRRVVDGALAAECQGSALAPYDVTVQIDNDQIVGSTCSCPYVYTDVCKHVGALLLDYRRNPEAYAPAPAGAGQRASERAYPRETGALVYAHWYEVSIRIAAARYNDALAYLHVATEELLWLSFSGEHRYAYAFVPLLLRGFPAVLKRVTSRHLRLNVFAYLVEVIAGGRRLNELQCTRDAEAIILEHIEAAELLPFVELLVQLHPSHLFQQGAWLDAVVDRLASAHFGRDEWEAYYLLCNDATRLLRHHLEHNQLELALIAARRVPNHTLIEIAGRERRHGRRELELQLLEAGHRGQPEDFVLIGVLSTKAWQRQDWAQCIAYDLKRFNVSTRGFQTVTMERLALRLGTWASVRRQIVIAMLCDGNINDMLAFMRWERYDEELLAMLPVWLAWLKPHLREDALMLSECRLISTVD